MFEHSGSIRANDTHIFPLPKKIQNLLAGHENVLDIGCASGWLMNYLSKETQYTGISYSQSDIDAVEKRGGKGFLVNLDTDTLPLEDNSISCIFLSHIIEHFEKAELIRLMNECYRVLKKDGRIICITPTDYHPFFYAEWTHVRPYNHGSLPGLLLDFNFREVDWTYPKLDWLPKKWQSLLRFPFFFLKFPYWREVAAWGKK